MAACDGEVNRPSNQAASEPELRRRHRPPVQRDFLGGVAHLGPQVAAVRIDQLLTRDVPQPEEEGQRPVRQIIRKSSSRFEIGILKDIRLVDPALEPPVEAEADHLLEPFAIEGEELGHGRLVPGGRSSQQFG